MMVDATPLQCTLLTGMAQELDNGARPRASCYIHGA